MKYALVDSKRTESAPRLKGICPMCRNNMTAKCGKYVTWHWAHKKKIGCDSWWENETEWHRRWKNYFPNEWQEVIHTDSKSGEQHIADVKNSDSVILEFQNSNISQEEVMSREKFYEHLVWVVNGNREDRLDSGTFQVSVDTGYEIINSEKGIIEFTWNGKSKIMERWSKSTCIVMIDFGDENIWELLNFEAENKKVKMSQITKREFLEYYGGTYKELT